jgi:phosphatidylglycerophosphate synthase
MQRELSVQSDQPAPATEDTGFTAESNGLFERTIIKTLCEPLLPHIPHSVHPNQISLVTHVVSWITAILAVSSPLLSPMGRSMALVGASIGMLFSMIGDCVDGMHARRSNQCSKLGEMMDHWLDAIIVPLVTIGISYALEVPAWALVVVNVTAAMVYNSQLILYHHTGRFVHPDTTSGVEAQFGVSVGYMAMAVFFYYVDRHARWLDIAIGLVCVLAVFVQMRCNAFYYVRLKSLTWKQLPFALFTTGFGALFLLGAIDAYAFAAACVFISFRICGTYVLSTIIKRPYGGTDWLIAGWLLAAFAAHFALPHTSWLGLSLPSSITLASCAYMVLANMVDFSRNFDALRPVRP